MSIYGFHSILGFYYICGQFSLHLRALLHLWSIITFASTDVFICLLVSASLTIYLLSVKILLSLNLIAIIITITITITVKIMITITITITITIMIMITITITITVKMMVMMMMIMLIVIKFFKQCVFTKVVFRIALHEINQKINKRKVNKDNLLKFKKYVKKDKISTLSYIGLLCKKVMKLIIAQNTTITDICGCYYTGEDNFLLFTEFNQTYDCPEEILDSKPIHSTPVPVYYVADESYTENLPSPLGNGQNDTLRHVYDQPEGNLSRGGSYIVADNPNGM